MTAIDMIKITVNLVVIYLVGGLVMTVVYYKTSPILFKKIEEEKQAALKTMITGADDIVKLGDWHPHEKHAEYYAAKKCGEVKVREVTDEKTGEIVEEKECIYPEDIGYIVEGYGKGYSSYIHMLASVDKDFLLKKVSILGHGETPGLGDEIEEDYFLGQFEGKGVDNLIVIKSETAEQIQAITGATISSRAVTEDGVKNGVEMLQEKLSGEVQE
jgi:electron transport complex protein RnfG